MRDGANLSVVKNHNQSLVLQVIREEEGISRVEIAQTTGLTPQTVTNVVNRLIRQGLVVEAGKHAGAAGKPRIRVRMNPAGGYAIGARIGRAEIAVVVVDLDGRVMAELTRPNPPATPPVTIVEMVAADVARLIAETGVAPDRIFGLGVAAPGPLDHEQGVVLGPPHFPGWENVPLRQMLAERTGLPVIIDYNAKAAATWERWSGAGRRIENFAFVYASTGVGAGVFLDGELRRGPSGAAGALGHVGVDPNGPICPCGARGCLEMYCAVPAIVARARREIGEWESSGDPMTFGAIERMIREGDPVAIRIVTDAARTLGYGIKNLINATDIDLVVLGGRLFSGAGDLFVATIQPMLLHQTYGHERHTVRVVLSSAPGDPGAVGAATLVLHTNLATRRNGLAPR